MRTLVRSLCFVFACTIFSQAQSTPDAVAREYLDAFNANDTAKVASFNVSSGMSILDEFSPFLWTGASAFSDWGRDFEANAKAHGISDPRVTLGRALVQNVTATGAYMIYPSVYTYKEKGVPMREAARMAIVLHKESGVWKVAAWTWTGTVPKAAR